MFANTTAAIGFELSEGAFELAFGGAAIAMKELQALVVALLPRHRVCGVGLGDVLFAFVVAAGLAEQEPLRANHFED